VWFAGLADCPVISGSYQYWLWQEVLGNLALLLTMLHCAPSGVVNNDNGFVVQFSRQISSERLISCAIDVPAS